MKELCTNCYKQVEVDVQEVSVNFSMNSFDTNMKIKTKISVCPICKQRILNTKLDKSERKRTENEYKKFILEKKET